MLAFTLAVALAQAPITAQPCMAPVVRHKRHHKLPAAPLQSCVVPPVAMCFRDPAPDPDLEPISQVVPHYVPAGTTDIVPYEVPPPVVQDCSSGDCYPPATWSTAPLDGIAIYGTVWAPDPGMPISPHLPPPDGRFPPPTGWHGQGAAPELDAGMGLGAVTLLAGTLVVLRARR